MNDLLRAIETNSTLLLNKSKSLFMASIPLTSSADLLIILREEQDEPGKADRHLTQAIIDDLVRRGAYQRAVRTVTRQSASSGQRA